MRELIFEGTIKTIGTSEKKTKADDIESGFIQIDTINGERIKIVGDKNLIEGFNPEEPVTLRLIRAQKTLKEAVESSRG